MRNNYHHRCWAIYTVLSTCGTRRIRLDFLYWCYGGRHIVSKCPKCGECIDHADAADFCSQCGAALGGEKADAQNCPEEGSQVAFGPDAPFATWLVILTLPAAFWGLYGCWAISRLGDHEPGKGTALFWLFWVVLWSILIWRKRLRVIPACLISIAVAIGVFAFAGFFLSAYSEYCSQGSYINRYSTVCGTLLVVTPIISLLLIAWSMHRWLWSRRSDRTRSST